MMEIMNGFNQRLEQLASKVELNGATQTTGPSPGAAISLTLHYIQQPQWQLG